jgi:polyvinyl alcohol dehydrogenase (cytochrome)
VGDRGWGARRVSVAIAAIALIAAACSEPGDDPRSSETTSTTAAGSSADSSGAGWPAYGHDGANTRTNVTDGGLAAGDVGSLAVDWELDGLVGVTGTPTVADGFAFFGDWRGTIWAVDAATGDEVWQAPLGGFVVGAVAVAEEAVFASSGRTLVRLDRDTGEEMWRVETHDHPHAQINASPVVVEDLVIQGTASFENTVVKDDYSFRGTIAAYDVDTGEEVWRFFTTADDDEEGPGAGVWSTPAIDPDRGLLYVGTGQSLEEPTAPLTDSLLALDYRTGELAWSTQFTYPDVFSAGNPGGKDADVGASPNLWTSDGRDLVGAGDKGGTFHALDRETGEVVWETELTPGSVFGGEIGSAAFVDGRLIASSNVGDPETNAPTDATKVFALDPATGEILWESGEVPGKIFGPVSAVPGVAFVGTDRGTLRALDVARGDELWSHDAPARTGGGPSIVDGRVLWGYGFTLFDGPGEGGVLSFAVPGSEGESEDASSEDRASGPSAGCDAPADMPAGSSEGTLRSGGEERVYQLDVPPTYDGTTPFGLVLGLHSLTVSYRVVPGMTGFPDMFGTHDFVGVAPSGLVQGTTPYWNAAPADDNYDVTFLADLLDHLETTLCLDTGRVFSVGMSNGAQMSSLAACRLPGRIAGIAPIAGVEFPEPCDAPPVPIIAFHGTTDPIVPYGGGGLSATRIAELHYYTDGLPPGLPEPIGVDESMARWAEHNGCHPDFEEERISSEVRHRRWQGCAAATEIYVVDGGGHAWPGKPVPQFEEAFGHATTDIDASSLLFDFFFDDGN